MPKSTKSKRCTVSGCTRAPSQGFKRCEPCRLAIRARQARIAAERRERGLCRCGGKRQRGYKLCAECRAYFSARQAQLQEERRLNGLCPLCGRKPKRGCVRCAECIEVGRAQNKRMWARWKVSGVPTRERPPEYWRRNQEGAKERIAAWKKRQRDAGNCVTCGRNADENPQTGEPYAMCHAHRDLATEAAVRRRQTARAATG